MLVARLADKREFVSVLPLEISEDVQLRVVSPLLHPVGLIAEEFDAKLELHPTAGSEREVEEVLQELPHAFFGLVVDRAGALVDRRLLCSGSRSSLRSAECRRWRGRP